MVRKPKIKYDWDDKRDICHKLYVEQKLSGLQIVKYFANHFNLPDAELPSPAQFYRQFSVWGFPPRKEKLTPEKEEAIIARVKELHAQNVPAKDILGRLHAEGFTIEDHPLRELRKKHGLRLRPVKRKSSAVEGDEEEGEDQDGDDGEAREPARKKTKRPTPPPLDPQEAARRAQRVADLRAVNEQRLQAGKRRRRIKGNSMLPPDAPGMEPRYKSETSLDECKAWLSLSNELYNQIRDAFEKICRQHGIIKQSLCVEGQWQDAKDQLVRENAHLSAVMHPYHQDLDKKAIALNCIGYDVTKRMRNQSKTMTVADANNVLGLGPLESKVLRRLFYVVLEEDHFTTVVECGNERLDELRERWYAQSDLLQRVVAEGDADERRALGVLDRDTRKRLLGDGKGKKDTQKTSKLYGPGPGAAIGGAKKKKKSDNLLTAENGTAVNGFNGPPMTTEDALMSSLMDAAAGASNPTTSYGTASGRQVAPVGPAWIGHQVPTFHPTTIADVGPPINYNNIDPELHQMNRMGGAASTNQQTNIPAYFRLSPLSTLIGHHPRMWLGKLANCSIEALHGAAKAKAGAATVSKVHGVRKNEEGNEDSWLTETVDELEVYLEEAGEKATFVVVLEGGYA